MPNLRSGKSVSVVALLCIAAAISAHAQTFSSLASFTKLNGAEPRGALVQGLDGAYYGTTSAGGNAVQASSEVCPDRCGVVFRITADGTLTTIHKFCPTSACADGNGPEAGLVLDSNGDFYGTTASGGVNSNCPPTESKCGTVFAMSPGGTLKTLYSFGDGTDGDAPFAALVQGVDGDLYGTTESGGAYNQGALFKITTQGVLTTVHSFCNPSDCTDFGSPGPIFLATDGNFYGITESVLYKITPAGALTVLYTYKYPAEPGNFLQGPDGKFYGTSTGNGTTGNGTFFEFTPGSAPNVLYNFQGPEGNGAAWLSLGSDGNFYGASLGGSSSCPGTCGTLFQITPGGALTTLHNFDGTDGMAPQGPPSQGTDGIFYGITRFGGTSTLQCFYQNDGCGTVYSLSMNLPPIVTTVPTAGPVGRNMYILGTDLTGATKVTFNGVSAAFTVLSPTAIRTQVPAGATTGPVQVVTPSATLTSGVVFGVF
jgi:uncharacterized repeat protein (TIGR03803 family)